MKGEDFVKEFETKAREIGGALEALTHHPAWEFFLDLIRLQEDNIKEKAIYEKDLPREYFMGALDQLRALMSALQDLVDGKGEAAREDPLAGLGDDIRNADKLTDERIKAIRERLKKIPKEDLVKAMRSGTMRSHSDGGEGGLSGIS